MSENDPNITINAIQQFIDEPITLSQQNYHSNTSSRQRNNILFNFQELENVQRERQNSRNQNKHINLLKPRSISNQDQSRSKNIFSRDSVNSIDTYVSNITLNSNNLANHNKNSDIFDLLKESDTSFSKNPRLHSNSNRIPFNDSQARLNRLPSILKDSSNQLNSKNDCLKANQNNQNVQVKQYIMDYQVQSTSHQQNNENKYVSTFLKNRCFKNYSYSKQYQQCKQKQYYLKAVEKSAFLNPNQSFIENENKPPELDISVNSITNTTINHSNSNQKKVNFISYNSYIKI